jgi:hypothetical protein
MATPTTRALNGAIEAQAELEAELRDAEDAFARGEFLDLTVEALDRCMAAGTWPWQHASSE